MLDWVWYPLAIVGGCAAVYGSLFLHELAHSVPILLVGGGISITVGSDDGRTVGLGPLSITFGVDGPWKTLQFGYYQPHDDHSKLVRATSAFAGPLVTVAIAGIVGAALLFSIDDGPLSVFAQIVFVSELSRAVYTAVPMTYSHEPYEGWPSDGRRLLDIVRS